MTQGDTRTTADHGHTHDGHDQSHPHDHAGHVHSLGVGHRHGPGDPHHSHAHRASVLGWLLQVAFALDVVVDPALSVNDAATIVARVKAALREQVPAFGDAMIAVVPSGCGAEGAGDMAPATHPTG